MNPQAILFDLDNTLVDRHASLTKYALIFYDDFKDQLLTTDETTVVNLVIWLDEGGYRAKSDFFADLQQGLLWTTIPSLDTLQKHWYDHYVAVTVGMDSLHDTLTTLSEADYSLGIITNGSAESQQGKIDQLEIEPYMQTVVISGAVGVKKPAPQIFEFALANLNVEAITSWFVGDHPVNDILGAAAVGLTPVWRRGFHHWPTEYPEPEYQIDNLPQLLTLLHNKNGLPPFS